MRAEIWALFAPFSRQMDATGRVFETTSLEAMVIGWMLSNNGIGAYGRKGRPWPMQNRRIRKRLIHVIVAMVLNGKTFWLVIKSWKFKSRCTPNILYLQNQLIWNSKIPIIHPNLASADCTSWSGNYVRVLLQLNDTIKAVEYDGTQP